jgi:hypothetical protein
MKQCRGTEVYQEVSGTSVKHARMETHQNDPPKRSKNTDLSGNYPLGTLKGNADSSNSPTEPQRPDESAEGFKMVFLSKTDR